MASTKSVDAIVDRMMAKAKPVNWIHVSKAWVEVREAFGISTEAASMLVFGLIATGTIRALDGEQQLIDLDECRIWELEGKPIFVRADELRDWLREWSVAPTADRDRAIAEKLRSGQIPGRNISWKKFCDDLRDKCNGWRAKGKAAWGVWRQANQTCC